MRLTVFVAIALLRAHPNVPGNDPRIKAWMRWVGR